MILPLQIPLVLTNPDAMKTLPERKPRRIRRAGSPRNVLPESRVMVSVVFKIEKIHVRIVKVTLEVDVEVVVVAVAVIKEVVVEVWSWRRL